MRKFFQDLGGMKDLLILFSVDHKWKFDAFKEMDKKTRRIQDSVSCEPLYANTYPFMNIWKFSLPDPPPAPAYMFQKRVLQSPYMGETCYTNPELCVSGFSIRIDVKGERRSYVCVKIHSKHFAPESKLGKFINFLTPVHLYHFSLC